MAKKLKISKLDDVLLVTDKQYLAALLQLLDTAKESVEIVCYSFAIGRTADSAPKEIAEKLIEIKKKNKKNLDIRIYLEGRRDTSERNRETAKIFKGTGIQTKFGSTHAKGFCVDGRYVLFGSTNLTHQSITKNNETNLFFDEPAVAKGFRKYFEHLWNGGKHGGIQLTEPMIADGDFMTGLIELIDRAKKTLEFSIYFFHHTELEKAFLRAHRRQVKIRGLVHNHASFALSYVRRTRGTAQRLLAGGIKDLHFGPPHLFTHSKYLIQDGDVIALGTGNWLREDVEINPQLYVLFKNKKIATELRQHLLSQITNQGVKIRPPRGEAKLD